MSRADTIAQDRWRVQVVRPDGTVSHEGTFQTEQTALNYYTVLHIEGSRVRLQVRLAGESRFTTLKSEGM